MGFFNDDICWCNDSNHCDKVECFRHMSNKLESGLYTCARLMGTVDCPYFEEKKDEEENEEKYVLTPWGCLYCVLLDYGIDTSRVSGKVGEHIVEDFMEAMEKAGYIAKSEEK